MLTPKPGSSKPRSSVMSGNGSWGERACSSPWRRDHTGYRRPLLMPSQLKSPRKGCLSAFTWPSPTPTSSSPSGTGGCTPGPPAQNYDPPHTTFPPPDFPHHHPPPPTASSPSGTGGCTPAPPAQNYDSPQHTFPSHDCRHHHRPRPPPTSERHPPARPVALNRHNLQTRSASASLPRRHPAMLTHA